MPFSFPAVPKIRTLLSMYSIILLIIGVALLVKGADLLVDGGSGIALKSGISSLVVGLTVVAFGTSAPELAGSLVAALQGSGDISFGNVVGSNVANIALILGVTALIAPVTVNRRLFRWELPLLVIISAFTWYLGWLHEVSRLHGIILLAAFGYYIHHCIKSPTVPVDVADTRARMGYPALIGMVVLGVAGLGLGGMLFVNGAQRIAVSLGVSEAVIGLTVVALGTSLPELLTSMMASIKGDADISLGNIVGSNIFNILMVIGTSATVQPYAISPDRFLSHVGLPVMMGLAVIMLPFAATGGKIGRREGAILAIIYVVYTLLAVVLG